MKTKGKIIKFDGFSGTIIDKEGKEHIFSNNDLITKEINIGDIVIFESELFKTVDVELYIARFIKK